MEMVWVRMPRRVSWSSFGLMWFSRPRGAGEEHDGALPQVIGNLIRRRADFLLKDVRAAETSPERKLPSRTISLS